MDFSRVFCQITISSSDSDKTIKSGNPITLLAFSLLNCLMSCIISFFSCILAKLFPEFCNIYVWLGLPKAFSIGEIVDPMPLEIRFSQPDYKKEDKVEEVEDWLRSESSWFRVFRIYSKDTLH